MLKTSPMVEDIFKDTLRKNFLKPSDIVTKTIAKEARTGRVKTDSLMAYNKTCA